MSRGVASPARAPSGAPDMCGGRIVKGAFSKRQYLPKVRLGESAQKMEIGIVGAF